MKKYSEYLINGAISALIATLAFLLKIRIDTNYSLLFTIITYFIIGIILTLIISFVLKHSNLKNPKNKIPEYIIGLIISLIILMISAKLLNSFVRLTYSSSLINSFILTFLIIVAPIILYLYLNRLFIKKLVVNTGIEKSMSAASYIFIAILIIGFFIPIPLLHFVIRPQISIPLILIILIILIKQSLEKKKEKNETKDYSKRGRSPNNKRKKQDNKKKSR